MKRSKVRGRSDLVLALRFVLRDKILEFSCRLSSAHFKVHEVGLENSINTHVPDVEEAGANGIREQHDNHYGKDRSAAGA